MFDFRVHEYSLRYSLNRLRDGGIVSGRSIAHSISVGSLAIRIDALINNQVIVFDVYGKRRCLQVITQTHAKYWSINNDNGPKGVNKGTTPYISLCSWSKNCRRLICRKISHVVAGKMSILGQPFFYMAFACCVSVYMVSVHTSST